MQNFSIIKSSIVSTLLFAFTSQIYAQTENMDVNSNKYTPKNGLIIITPTDVQWRDGPKRFPTGTQYAILDGRLKSGKSTTIRVKFPANFQMPPHYRYVPIRMTILSGSLNVGIGNNLDPNSATPLVANTFAIIPARKPVYFSTTEETIIQMTGSGLTQIQYLHAHDRLRDKQPVQPLPHEQTETTPVAPYAPRSTSPIRPNMPASPSLPETTTSPRTAPGPTLPDTTPTPTGPTPANLPPMGPSGGPNMRSSTMPQTNPAIPSSTPSQTNPSSSY